MVTMKKIRVASVILLIIISSTISPAAAITVTDDMGVIVTIPIVPQRIISLSPSTTEILFALGLDDRVVGVTEFCNYPPTALDKPRIGGYSTVSIEKVIAQKPDLVVAAYGNGEELVDQLRSLNLTVISMNPQTISGVMNDITIIGEATGARENASVLRGSLEARIQRVEDTASRAATRPRVAHVIWNDPIYVSGNGTFQNEMIDIAGGVNAFQSIEGWKNIGIEDFIIADPDVLIVNAGTGMTREQDVIAEYFLEEPRFKNVKAIRDHRVYIVDTDSVDRAGPRIVDALEDFARDIHPELYGNTTSGVRDTPSRQAAGFGPFTLACAGAGATMVLICRSRGKGPGPECDETGCRRQERHG